ncbi:methylamine utilization protein [Pseudoalteromonas sp. T1lg65]|uniref:methylamine utilization protein n=1 Tax=Pseudoalteromonas sp. T1lg65 TaxID=2077101 RepID=UPI003F78BE31
MNKRSCQRLFSLGLLLTAFCKPLFALEVQITNRDGAPLANAAVWINAKGLAPIVAAESYHMGQKEKAFTPHLLIVPKGAQVSFPNFDSILHHVYSFSPAKPFEIKLYRDDPKNILFDQAGIVELGCNIHDWMLGYILVVDAGAFAITDANGRATLAVENSALKNVTMQVWHERFTDLQLPESLLLPEVRELQVIRYQLQQQLLAPIEDFSDEFDDY